MTRLGRNATPIRRPWWRPLKRHLVRSLPRRKRMLGTWLHRMLGNRLFDPLLWKPNEETVARGMVVGTFFGLMPFFGMQIFLSTLVCYFWRVNVTTAALATFISNPLTAVPLMWLQFKFGRFIMNPWAAPLSVEPVVTPGNWAHYGKPFILGALVSSIIAAIVVYPLTHLIGRGIDRLRARANYRRYLKQLDKPEST